MSKTYFARHSSGLDLDNDTIKYLWDNDYVAIHYPHSKNNDFEEGDSQSLDPNDYANTAKSALIRMKQLAEQGGYIFAVYRDEAGGKIGYVKPGSQVELIPGKWGNKHGRQGRDAILKAIKVGQVKNLSAGDSISLKSAQPRQAAFVQWSKCGSRVKSMVEGHIEKTVGSLTPDQQEVMCMEFLRSPNAKMFDLPVLSMTLCPVGRTLPDIDILGATADGKKIYGQVTSYHIKDSSAGPKLNRLKAYVTDDSSGKAIFFCHCDQPETRDGVYVFPLDLVFEQYCNQDSVGQQWWNLVSGQLV